MAQVDWVDLVKYLVLSAVGFACAIRTQLGERRSDKDPYSFGYNLRLFAKLGGWTLAIGCLLIAMRVLALLLSQPS